MRSKLSVACIAGTARILRTEFPHFSPAFGLLTWLSPQLMANLRTLPLPPSSSSSSSSQSIEGNLARELFYQREDGNKRRYGSIALTNSKSQAAYWLSPKLAGTILGLAISESTPPLNSSKRRSIDEVLISAGIACNYVNGEWSGVSLARFRKLIALLATDYASVIASSSSSYSSSSSSSSSSSTSSPHCIYSLPLFLAFVWERASNKRCLLDFILETEKAAGFPILSDSYADLRVENSPLQLQWLQESLQPADLTKEKVIEAVELLTSSSPWTLYPPDYISSAIEIVFASLARERIFKPAIRLGRCGHKDGPLRPDCVEVVIREIIESLIFGRNH